MSLIDDGIDTLFLVGKIIIVTTLISIFTFMAFVAALIGLPVWTVKKIVKWAKLKSA